MGKKKRSKTSADNSVDDRDFETALAELQSKIQALEEGSLGLDDSMREFEQGVRLLRRCYAVLDQAEQKIEILTRLDDEGRPVVASFDGTSTVSAQTTGTTPQAGRRQSRRSSPVTDADETTADSTDEEAGDGPSLFPTGE